MLQFLAGVLVSEILALWLEFFYKFGAFPNPKGFFIAIPLYFLFLCMLHGLFSTLEGLRFHTPMCLGIGGMFGLLLEWFLVGNSPWQNPNALQWAQFLVHAVYPILGYLIVRTSQCGKLRTHLLVYLLLASLLTSTGFIIKNSDGRILWFLFLPIFTYFGLLYFVYKYSRIQQTRRA